MKPSGGPSRTNEIPRRMSHSGRKMAVQRPSQRHRSPPTTDDSHFGRIPNTSHCTKTATTMPDATPTLLPRKPHGPRTTFAVVAIAMRSTPSTSIPASARAALTSIQTTAPSTNATIGFHHRQRGARRKAWWARGSIGSAVISRGSSGGR